VFVRVDDWADSVKPIVTELECASCRGRVIAVHICLLGRFVYLR